eukprot:symbB.v1.2.003665.t1/scaffold175.1/size369221/21
MHGRGLPGSAVARKRKPTCATPKAVGLPRRQRRRVSGPIGSLAWHQSPQRRSTTIPMASIRRRIRNETIRDLCLLHFGARAFSSGEYPEALYMQVFCTARDKSRWITLFGSSNKLSVRAYFAHFCSVLSRPAGANLTVPADRVEDVKKLKQSTHLNMAACYLKLGEHRKCIDACTKALSTSPLSKAYFRRGQAHLELRSLDEAKEDFERARELEPDPAIDKELKRLKQAFSQHDAKEKKRFAKMFSKMQEELGKWADLGRG